MIIYRVQNKKNEGPYTYKAWGTAVTYIEERHPTPANDGIDREDIKTFTHFGFKSIEQFGSWFNEAERVLLINEGFDLVEYHVPEHLVVYGRSQLIFDSRQASVIRTHNIADIPVNSYGQTV